MTALLLLVCLTEFKSIRVVDPVMPQVEGKATPRTFEDLWVGQCVARKEAGL